MIMIMYINKAMDTVFISLMCGMEWTWTYPIPYTFKCYDSRMLI